jgi:hypothetical protein
MEVLLWEVLIKIFALDKFSKELVKLSTPITQSWEGIIAWNFSFVHADNSELAISIQQKKSTTLSDALQGLTSSEKQRQDRLHVP